MDNLVLSTVNKDKCNILKVNRPSYEFLKLTFRALALRHHRRTTISSETYPFNHKRYIKMQITKNESFEIIFIWKLAPWSNRASTRVKKSLKFYKH